MIPRNLWDRTKLNNCPNCECIYPERVKTNGPATAKSNCRHDARPIEYIVISDDEDVAPDPFSPTATAVAPSQAATPRDTADGANASQSHSFPQKPFPCPECSKSFQCKWTLKAHRKSHQTPFICNICNKELGYKRGLKRHMERAHRNKKNVESRVQQANRSTRTFLNAEQDDAEVEQYLTNPRER
ncbi:hypothetical protein FRB99_003134 [Tulasnella sp. 403]|nr:hypothetical protein FRB99_003134 [Tulasnella sp. 403]